VARIVSAPQGTTVQHAVLEQNSLRWKPRQLLPDGLLDQRGPRIRSARRARFSRPTWRNSPSLRPWSGPSDADERQARFVKRIRPAKSWPSHQTDCALHARRPKRKRSPGLAVLDAALDVRMIISPTTEPMLPPIARGSIAQIYTDGPQTAPAAIIIAELRGLLHALQALAVRLAIHETADRWTGFRIETCTRRVNSRFRRVTVSSGCAHRLAQTFGAFRSFSR
jgi:hypothetical protein